jgi:hypothetical protein
MQSADTRRPSGEEAHPAHGEPRVHPIFFQLLMSITNPNMSVICLLTSHDI